MLNLPYTYLFIQIPCHYCGMELTSVYKQVVLYEVS